MTEYEANIERDLLSGDWMIRVRYVSGSVGERRTFRRFILVPSHQGAMFSDVCEEIEAAIEAHRDGRVSSAVRS